jgi:FtsP/CotA-like multicopper oxidase with cupredoxin domain
MTPTSVGGLPTILRTSSGSILFLLLAATALGQGPAADQIIVSQNRTPAGKLANGVLDVRLELREGAWRPEAEDGPKLFVQAFGEADGPSQIPGPMLRMAAGTQVHATVSNKLRTKATVYGLNTRPGDAKAGIEIPAGGSRELTFLAGAPGTYFYWARTVTPEDRPRPYLADALLTGAFIVDPPGPVPPDRVFVIGAMVAPADVLHEDFEVVTINGKSYPFTEPLEYIQGETIRWRVINPGFGAHPMHLHGSFYQVLSLGDSEADTAYAEGERQSVVTETLLSGHTMMMEWKPNHVGRWLFHCHFAAHMSSDERVPMLASETAPAHAPSAAHEQHDGMGTMNDMAGLVMRINVSAAAGSPPVREAEPRHKVDLVIETTAANGKSPAFSCSVRDGKKIVASEDRAMGPPIVLTRGEPAEITVLNHLKVPTVIHWHGIELDSYYDGVVGGGTANQVTPAIAAGGSFVARFTPNRAGTFIYHTHAPDPDQLSGGVYGALIVLESGEQFDPEHDRLLIMGAREPGFDAMRLTLNGAEHPNPIVLNRSVQYRLRLINMGANLAANFQLGTKEKPATWRAIAKDGATLPPRLVKTSEASLIIASGETYDFEFQPDAAGEIPIEIVNLVSKAKLSGTFLVQ